MCVFLLHYFLFTFLFKKVKIYPDKMRHNNIVPIAYTKLFVKIFWHVFLWVYYNLERKKNMQRVWLPKALPQIMAAPMSGTDQGGYNWHENWIGQARFVLAIMYLIDHLHTLLTLYFGPPLLWGQCCRNSITASSTSAIFTNLWFLMQASEMINIYMYTQVYIYTVCSYTT